MKLIVFSFRCTFAKKTTMKQKIAILGCGNLGQSIARGLLDSGLQPNQLFLTRRNMKHLSSFAEKGVHVGTDNIEAVQFADVVLFSLKPYTILDVVLQIVPELDPKRHTLVSLATGITLAQMEEIAGSELPIYRAMPNTAADVNQSLTCLCGNQSKNDELVKSIFNSVGTTVFIDEYLMEGATVLGACGIAFALRFIRAMIQGGIQIGFDAETAKTIVNQTVMGAAELLLERKNHPEFEIDKVTTPRGCTIEGLNEMEHNGFSSALIKGIISSYRLIEKE